MDTEKTQCPKVKLEPDVSAVAVAALSGEPMNDKGDFYHDEQESN